MNPLAPIADVARRYLGTHETSTNQGPHLAEFWKATSYPSGATDRQPWCSAFVSFCVKEADRLSDSIKLRVPPFFPAVSQWLPWANTPSNGCQVFTSHDARFRPLAGDVVVFLPHLSHVGIVSRDYDGKGVVHTIEGNTNFQGSREGDGVYEKERMLTFCGSFIRLPASAVAA